MRRQELTLSDEGASIWVSSILSLVEIGLHVVCDV